MPSNIIEAVEARLREILPMRFIVELVNGYKYVGTFPWLEEQSLDALVQWVMRGTAHGQWMKMSRPGSPDVVINCQAVVAIQEAQN
jgi:hypothetical protein